MKILTAVRIDWRGELRSRTLTAYRLKASRQLIGTMFFSLNAFSAYYSLMLTRGLIDIDVTWGDCINI